MSSHIAEPLYWLTKKRYLSNKCSKEELYKMMEDVVEHLLTVIQIWGPYRKASTERLTAENARADLEVVDNRYHNVVKSLYFGKTWNSTGLFHKTVKCYNRQDSGMTNLEHN